MKNVVLARERVIEMEAHHVEHSLDQK